MPVIFYIFGAIALFAAVIAVQTFQVALAATIVVSAVFCFGFGYMIDLLQQIRNNTRRAVEPRRELALKPPDGYEDVYQGYPYRRLAGGSIEVLVGNGTRVFKSWKEFNAAVGG